MTNQEIGRIAREQSAVDSGCRAEDFLTHENQVVISRPHPQARRYLELPFFCDLTSYGHNVVASVSGEIAEAVRRYIAGCSAERCFETPRLHLLMEELKAFDTNICFMAEYFLPDVDQLRIRGCGYETRLLLPSDFTDCYVPEWGNALCEKRRELDRLAMGAFDGGKLVGLAGCSADCDTMWQIGIDVLPAYRGRGIAAALTSQLAAAVLERGIVPFYCCAWSNIGSARNAIKSGFRPAWVQVTAKARAFIDGVNA